PSQQVLENAGSRGGAPLGVELDAGDRRVLDGGADPPLVIRRRAHHIRVVWLGGEAVREVDVGAGHTVHERGGTRRDDGVPAEVRHPSGSQAPHRPREQLETGAALLALTEEKLEPHTDPRDRAPDRDSVAERVVQAVPREPGRGALDVSYSGDQRERGVANDRRINGHDGVRTCPDERRRQRAKIARAVVRDRDPHAAPFVDRIPAPPGATACRNDRPSALYAASAMWWSSAPAASTCTVQPASIASRSRACRSSDVASEPTLSPVNARETSACGRRTRSTAAVARASSIGSTAEPYRATPSRAPSASASAAPRAAWTSSTVWCSSTSTSPAAARSRSNPAWKASSVSRWSRNPSEVSTRDRPVPSSASVSRSAVSVVVRRIVASRPPC